MHTKRIFTGLAFAVVLSACSSSPASLFSKKTPLEKYEEKLEDAGLHKTPEGREWLAASERAFQYPLSVGLPYRHNGRFSPTKPQALALAFTARPGQRLLFTVNKTDTANFVLYAEVYRRQPNGNELLQAVDTNVADFAVDISEAGDYLLKLQPQLFRAGDYQLSIATGPSLLFPVADKKAYIGSLWGDARDGGKRSHEGVDIFAPKRTPAVAAADGVITSVREGGIGGKTVWLRPEGKALHLYYAHLDEQLVQEGQRVKKGDVVGLVGNTGNARTTPPHLHFGVYGYGGPVDPFAFVNPGVKSAPVVAKKALPEQLRLLKEIRTGGTVLKKHSLLQPLAVTTRGYLALLPDGRSVQTEFDEVQSATQALKKVKATAPTTVYKEPAASGAATTVGAGSSLSVMGYYNEYAFVRSGNAEGWVLQANLRG